MHCLLLTKYAIIMVQFLALIKLHVGFREHKLCLVAFRNQHSSLWSRHGHRDLHQLDVDLV